jgi:hypothetical protein
MALLSRRIRWIVTGVVSILLLYQMVAQEKKMKQTTQQYRTATTFDPQHQANHNSNNNNNSNHNSDHNNNNGTRVNRTLPIALYNSSHNRDTNQTVTPPSGTALLDRDDSDLSLSTSTTTTAVIPSTETHDAMSNKTAGVIGVAETLPLLDSTRIERDMSSMSENTNTTTAPIDSELSSSIQTTTTTNTPIPVTNDDSSWTATTINTTTTTNSSSSTSTTTTTFSFYFSNISQRFPLPSSTYAAWLQDFLTTQPTATHLQSLNNPQQKFIVMTCHKYEQTKLEACGGFTDRVKLIPYYMWLAQHTNRMLLIHYTKPHALEHFFEPPPGPPETSFDWRVPPGFFHDEFLAYAHRTHAEYNTQRRILWHNEMMQPEWLDTRVIFVNNNLALAPSLNYLEKVGHVVTSDVQARVFRQLFYPTKALQEHIQATATVHHLIPGQYAGVHMRAKYPAKNSNITLNYGVGDKEGGGIRMENSDTQRAIAEIVDNAMNCIMTVMPETPVVYVASDSNEPIEYLLKESIWAIAGGTTNNFTHPHPKWYSSSTSSSSSLPPPPAIPVNRQWNTTTKPAPKVVARLDFEVEPIHFDSDHGRGPQPQDMYPTFVDLWILAHAKCISQGVGGYSEFASQLTGNFRSCRAIHRHKQQGILKCPEYFVQPP